MKAWKTLLIAAALVMAAASDSAQASELSVTGSFVQGGLVFGQTAPGSDVEVDGKRVRVSDKGEFLMGFGRDAARELSVRVRAKGGNWETKTFAVERRRFPTQRIDGLPPKQVTPDPETLKRIRAEGALIKAARTMDSLEPLFRSGFMWPVRGIVSGVFGSQRILNGKPRAPHGGVDIAAPKGTPIVSCADGIVSLVHPDMFYTGKSVMIDHGFGLASVYIHMSQIHVKEGQTVSKGTRIGEVGSSGRATGPHLHWGISLFQTRLDPALLVPPMEGRQ
ncbi:MAG: M23 family metallopeptidase [Rhodospirillales bacterium]|nr:M23 family metallopeptidase [Rhodospirillales bacterium]